MLTQKQKETYANDGYVILSNIIPDKNLQAMQTDLDKWIEEYALLAAFIDIQFTPFTKVTFGRFFNLL